MACVATLVDATPSDVDMRGGVGRKTPLQMACAKGNDNCAALLLKLGANVNAVSEKKGRSALHEASHGRHLDCARLLLGMGADPNARTKGDDDTPAHEAARSGHLDVLQFLIGEARCDIGLSNGNGDLPLHDAIRGGFPECAEVLVAAGSPLDAQNRTGDGPIHELAMSKSADFVSVLKAMLDGGAAVDLQGSQGRTALHWSAINGHALYISILVEAGADVEKRDDHGHTPEKISKGRCSALLKQALKKKVSRGLL